VRAKAVRYRLLFLPLCLAGALPRLQGQILGAWKCGGRAAVRGVRQGRSVRPRAATPGRGPGSPRRGSCRRSSPSPREAEGFQVRCVIAGDLPGVGRRNVRRYAVEATARITVDWALELD
jgi:hypothetical protein